MAAIAPLARRGQARRRRDADIVHTARGAVTILRKVDEQNQRGFEGQ